jgi:hypothetical protein
MSEGVPGHLIVMTDDDRKRVEEFASKIDSTVRKIYEARDGQRYDFKPMRLQEQQVGAKLSELAVYRYISSLGIQCTEPDFEIYERKKKNFSPDMKLADGSPIHVKSQEPHVAERHGISWMVEKTDKELYINTTGYVALCLVSRVHNTVRLLGLPKATFLKEKGILFGQPKKESLRETKSTIYYDELRLADESDVWALKNVECQS